MKNYFLDNFSRSETKNEVIYKSDKPNKDGFKINISFTKDQKEHEESMKVIKEFFIREIF